MKRVLILILLFFLIQGCAATNHFNVDANRAKEFPPAKEIRVSVLPLIAPTPGKEEYSAAGGRATMITSENAGTTVADIISNALLSVPNIKIVERSQLEKILIEHKLLISGIVKEPDFKLLGEILPVDAIVFGTITKYFQYYDRVNWGATIAYSARMVNIRTSEVLFTMHCSANEFNGMTDDMANRVAKEAIRKALEK
jgi:curli biogenesis system outer membrane secretion channel CsgG